MLFFSFSPEAELTAAAYEQARLMRFAAVSLLSDDDGLRDRHVAAISSAPSLGTNFTSGSNA